MFGTAEQVRSFLNGCITAGRAFKIHDRRKVNVNDLGPEIARHVDLGRRACTFCLKNNPVQDFGDAGCVTDLFLIGNHVLEKSHLLNFLKTALSQGLIRRLRRNQKQRSVIPVGGFYGRNEVCDTRTVLGNHHAEFACRPGIAIGHHPARAFVRAIPKRNPRFWKQIGNRHEGRADNPKRMLNPMPLQDFYEGFLGRHSHLG